MGILFGLMPWNPVTSSHEFSFRSSTAFAENHPWYLWQIFFLGWDRTHEDFVCMYMFCFDSDRLLGWIVWLIELETAVFFPRFHWVLRQGDSIITSWTFHCEIQGMKRFMMAIHLRFPGITSQVLASLVVGRWLLLMLCENDMLDCDKCKYMYKMCIIV